MDLLISESGKVFNTEAVQKGFLVSAKHKCWDEPKNGIISSVTPDELRILYCPGIANVTRFFFVRASEVDEGQWELRWSEDMTSIEEYKPEEVRQDDA